MTAKSPPGSAARTRGGLSIAPAREPLERALDGVDRIGGRQQLGHLSLGYVQHA